MLLTFEEFESALQIVGPSTEHLKRVADSEHPDAKKLDKKLRPWWRKHSQGNITTVHKDGTYKTHLPARKTSKAQRKEIRQLWKELGEDRDVEAIIWSPISSDELTYFIQFLLAKPPRELNKLLAQQDLVKHILTNYKKFFAKERHVTTKDHVFRRRPNYENQPFI